MGTEIRELTGDDIPDVRRLQSRAPTKHLAHTLDRFPRFFHAIAIVDPAPEYFSRQIRTLGAFSGGTLIGTVGLQQVPAETERHDLPETVVEQFHREFTEHDAVVFDTLRCSLEATFIGAPELSYEIHSLHVLAKFRRQGVATNLLNAILNACTLEQRECLFIETARERPLRQFVETFGFKCVKRTFSCSERLEYGTWGALLFQYLGDRMA